MTPVEKQAAVDCILKALDTYDMASFDEWMWASGGEIVGAIEDTGVDALERLVNVMVLVQPTSTARLKQYLDLGIMRASKNAGYNALRQACLQKHLNVVLVLLQSGASPIDKGTLLFYPWCVLFFFFSLSRWIQLAPGRSHQKQGRQGC